MLETTKKYSEEAYWDKRKLREELEPYPVDPVWEEIQKYRNIFRVDYPLDDGKVYLVWNRFTITKLLECMQVIEQYRPHEVTNVPVPEVLLGLTSAPYSGQEMRLWLQHATERLDNVLSACMLELLCNPREPVLVKVFFLTLYSYDEDYIRMVLTMNGYDKLWDMVKELKVSNQEDKDKTSLFHSFLRELQLKITDRMVSLKNSMKEDVRHASASILSKCYPNCTTEQIHFYVEHRTLHHYYTIKDYMVYCQVCHETARTALEQLVQMKWYQKQKLGKKFVYYIP